MVIVTASVYELWFIPVTYIKYIAKCLPNFKYSLSVEVTCLQKCELLFTVSSKKGRLEVLKRIKAERL